MVTAIPNASLSMNKSTTDTLDSTSNTAWYVKSLQTYLAERRVITRFCIGEWLGVLTSEALNSLHELTELALSSEKRHDDVYLPMRDICELAFISEQYPGLIPKTSREVINAIDHLRTLISLVAVSRAGYIKLTKPLSLSLDSKKKFVVTEAGRQIGIRLGSRGA